MNQELEMSDISEKIVDKFKVYHAANPMVWELFKKFSYEAKNSGRKRFGVNAIFERMRWYIDIETSGDRFKLNNNYRSCYARLIISEDPFFQTFFETRRSSEKFTQVFT